MDYRSDITTTPTAGLLAEINRLGLDCERYLDHVAHGLDTDGDADKYSENVKNIAAITSELDRRCSEAGIKIENGCFLYSVIEYEYIEDDGDGNVSWGYGFVPEITAKEQHDLEAWLLMKGGNG